MFDQCEILNVDTNFLVEQLLKKFCPTYIFSDGHLMLNFYTFPKVCFDGLMIRVFALEKFHSNF